MLDAVGVGHVDLGLVDDNGDLLLRVGQRSQEVGRRSSVVAAAALGPSAAASATAAKAAEAATTAAAASTAPSTAATESAAASAFARALRQAALIRRALRDEHPHAREGVVTLLRQ